MSDEISTTWKPEYVDMERQQLMAVCSEVFAKQTEHLPGNCFFRSTKPEMLEMLRSGKVSEKILGAGAKGGDMPNPGAAGDAFVQMVTAIAQQVVPKGAAVDEATLNKVVAKQVEEAIASATRRVEIVMPGQPPKAEDLAHEKYALVLQHLAAGDHVYLVGPAGTGKTTMAEKAAKALSLVFGAISCGPTTSKVDLLGFKDASGNYQRTLFRDLFEYGGLFVFDEIDNASAEVITQLNAALANGYMLFADGKMVQRHESFRCVACANTWGTGATREFGTRAELDAATLDRFSQIIIDYDTKFEVSLAKASIPSDASRLAVEWSKLVWAARKADKNEGALTGTTTRTILAGARLLACCPKGKAEEISKFVDHVLSCRLYRGAPEIAVNRVKTAVLEQRNKVVGIVTDYVRDRKAA